MPEPPHLEEQGKLVSAACIQNVIPQLVTTVVALTMDGESETNPVAVAVEEEVEAGGLVEPGSASPKPQTPPPPHGDLVTATTGSEAPKEEESQEDDDVVLVGEEEACPPPPTAADRLELEELAPPPASPVSSNASQKPAATSAEPIVIDDEEDCAQKDGSPAGGRSPSASPEPDSEIRIASVTTLGSSTHTESSTPPPVDLSPPPEDLQPDMNLMITSVTSLQGEDAAMLAPGDAQLEENGLQISSAFSLNPDNPSAPPVASFNPGRGSLSQLVQNGDSSAHNRTDEWISQSASVPRNLKQTCVDSPSPAMPKPPGQSSSSTSSTGSQPRTVKVTCANCKKPLKKGQTAYQRKGSTHLFCSTTCLSAFSHKPTPKKSCTMCKKDITNMKGTIVAQVDSSETFQEFCSTGCLGAYENKQNPPKSGLKTKCTVCGKLTEIRHEVSFKTVTHKICSDACFNAYRRANGLIMNCCEQCGDYLPSRAAANHFLLVDGQQKRFCCQNCIRDFKQAHSKLASCQTCKTLIKTGEVLHGLGTSGTMGSFCSTSCLNKQTIVPNAGSEPTCHFCKRNSLPQYQAALPEGNVLNFCSSQCVTKFQNATLQTATNGQASPSGTNALIQLKCNYCRGAFSLKPEILEWEDKVHQFCSKTCCEDYKKLHCIVTFCEYCQEEKTLHEMVKFSGEKKPFCSEGCKLLFKQDFIRRLGLKCVSCNHCNQLCKRSVTRQLGAMTRDFCSEPCADKFNDWYYKAARCDCCKVQGNLTESVMWRTEMKHFCDQECLLRFYLQQNEPIMVTQKGPENSSLGLHVAGSKLGMVNQNAGTFPAGGLVRDVKNKAVLCKPLTLTKATYCKPHMQSKPLQTDVDDGVKREYVPVPIPVPVFIPVPMNMYAQVTPTPVSLPVPLPVPVFLPSNLQGAERLLQTVKDLKTESSSGSLQDVKPDVKIKVKTEHEKKSSSVCLEEEEDEEEKYDPDLDLENDFQGTSEGSLLEGKSQDAEFPSPVLDEETALRPQSRQIGNKKQAVEDASCLPGKPRDGRSLPLRARYGINAWKRWALSLTGQSEDIKGKDGSKAERPGSNMLLLSSAELNAALTRFVKEACRPNGERYTPDSIFYLCLGIQQHLHAKGRKDDLFSDPCYQEFGLELDKVLKDWKPTVLPDGSPWGRVEEQSLWSGRHLGQQSPAALLRSLVYLNTKYFGLRTVEQHLRLSFANVYGPDTVHPVTRETTVCIRNPSVSQDDHGEPGSRKRKRTQEDEENDEDANDSLSRCPVKKHECRLYELYRSKCPPSLRQRLDFFYVQPDPACDPDDPLWFSSTPLERRFLESLLTRALAVANIYTDAQRE